MSESESAVRCHNYDDKGEMCGGEATDLIRTVGVAGGVAGWQGRQLGHAKIPVCSDCGEYLVEDAEIDWEFVSRRMDPEELAELATIPDGFATYEDYEGRILQPGGEP